jgi:hypothetical protein
MSSPNTAETAKEPEPSTLEEAEAQLEKAKSELDRLALNEPPPSASQPAAAPSPAKAEAAPQRAARDEARRADKSSAGAEAPEPVSAPNACETACKAFSSLARAGDAVCRLDTEAGKRCERARRIVSEAEQRVMGCGCAR